MSVWSALNERVARAAPLGVLVMALGVSSSAPAQLPRSLPSASADPEAPLVALDADAADSPLVLRRLHLDVRVHGQSATVRSTFVYRNAGAEAVDALYTLSPQGTVHGPDGTLIAMAGRAHDDEAGCGDQPAAHAQFLEAGEPAPGPHAQGIVRVDPGADVTIRLHRATVVPGRDHRRRLALPLPSDRGSAFAPVFSADVLIAAGALNSPQSATHAVQTRVLGAGVARLVPSAHRAAGPRFFAVDFELGRSGDELAALDPVAPPMGRPNLPSPQRHHPAARGERPR
jgi:hypothetical protein